MLFRLTVVAGFTSFMSVAYAAKKYEVVDLGVFCNPTDATKCGELTYPYSINNSGTIVGHAQGWLVTTTVTNADGTTTTTNSRRTHAFRWENGALFDLGDLGRNENFAAGINSVGDIAGHAVKVTTPATATTPEVAQFRAFRRLASDELVQDLGVPAQAVNFMRALSIAENGAIVGYSQVKAITGDDTFYTRGFIWSPDTLAVTVIPAFNEKSTSSLRAVNSDAGFAVGFSFKDGTSRAMKVALNAPTTLLELGTLGGTQSQANNLNNSGKIVGWSWTANNGRSEAFLYDPLAPTTMRSLGQLSENYRYSEANAINNDGLIVGTAQASTGVVRYHAVLQDSNDLTSKWVDLNSLVDCPAAIADRWEFTEATDINDEGQIIGYGAKGGKTRGFLLNPVEGEETQPVACTPVEGEFENQGGGGGAFAALLLPMLVWRRRRRTN